MVLGKLSKANGIGGREFKVVVQGQRRICTPATKETSRESQLSPLSIVSRDLRYLQDYASSDLINTLAPVREAHEQVIWPHTYVHISLSVSLWWLPVYFQTYLTLCRLPIYDTHILCVSAWYNAYTVRTPGVQRSIHTLQIQLCVIVVAGLIYAGMLLIQRHMFLFLTVIMFVTDPYSIHTSKLPHTMHMSIWQLAVGEPASHRVSWPDQHDHLQMEPWWSVRLFTAESRPIQMTRDCLCITRGYDLVAS